MRGELPSRCMLLAAPNTRRADDPRHRAHLAYVYPIRVSHPQRETPGPLLQRLALTHLYQEETDGRQCEESQLLLHQGP